MRAQEGDMQHAIGIVFKVFRISESVRLLIYATHLKRTA